MQACTPITLISVAVLLAACAEQQNPGPVAGKQPPPPQSQHPVTAPQPEPAARDEAELRVQAAPAAKMQALPMAEAGAYRADRDAFRAIPPGLAHPVDRENYLHYTGNPVKLAAREPVSTFSIDVDTAGYANIRRMLSREGRLPPPDAVRLEEMINYFSYHYPAPESPGIPFGINTELAPAPWNDRHQLLQVGIKGYQPAPEERPPANLVFLVDVSGSMRSPDKLGLVKQSLRLLVNRMSAEDRIALAVYAGNAGTVLESTPGSEKAKILTAIDALEAGGSTHGSAGINLAYQLAQQHLIDGGINRVVIASDGDMNVGTVDLEALKGLIARKRETGIALTTLGFGTGNYNYALMEQLADVGNGNAAYIDTLQEAQKVLVNELQSTLLTIASDVKIQVEFNPAVVAEYRLIGYENRLLDREDFTNDRVDAGDIGAGHTVTALYEVTLVGSGGEQIPELRYGGPSAPDAGESSELAYVKLRYKRPGESTSIEIGQAVLPAHLARSVKQSSSDMRFAASVAGFGQLLQGGKHTGSWSYADALQLARSARGEDPHGYRGEFLHLIELAQSLSSQG